MLPTPPRAVIWRLGPSIARADIPALCERLRLLLGARPRTTVLYDVRALDAPDLTTVEALLRLQLTARRLGHGIRLCHVPDGLGLLLTVTGLAEILPAAPLPGASPRPP
ncbi:STAS domain-containing protein [Streptomyces decoyicus]|uniref:STAS domain-containing protein n=1 Tax=Streptomyces decoyicus TaxID=249567 RepID=UPI002E17C54C|nr:STAS domain-containing protein [Streptomyces decoyicus]